MGDTGRQGRALPRHLDPRTFLCETCGYVLDDTPLDGACPECGTAVAASLPERRVGTEMQLEATLGSVIWYQGKLMFSPVEFFSRMSLATGWERGVLFRSCFFSAVMFFIAMIVMFKASLWLASGGTTVSLDFFGIFMLTLTAFIGWIGLTYIEAIGVLLLSKRRGWRVPWRSAIGVCGHAAGVWWISGLICLAVTAFTPQSWMSAITEALPSLIRNALPKDEFLLLLAGFTLGMLVFETYVYIGVRRCRFANGPEVVISLRVRQDAQGASASLSPVHDA